MGRNVKKNSQAITKTDGRKNNGGKRLPKKPGSGQVSLKSPSQLNKAKKDRIGIYALNAMKKVFGSEEEAWESLAEQAQSSFSHMNLLWQYRYGKPAEQGAGDGGEKKMNVPVINFYASTEQIKEVENTIEVEHEEDDEEDS